MPRSLRASALLVPFVCLAISACGGSGGGSAADSAAAPVLLSASAPSRHYVVVRFDAPAGDLRPADFLIQALNGTSLQVIDVAPGERQDEALLTTATQQPVTYTVTFRGPANSNSQAAVAAEALPEPQLATAIGLSTTTVLLTFSDAMFDGAENPAFYEITAVGGSGRGVAVVGADLSLDGTEVVLTTSVMEQLEYHVRVTNVFRRDGIRIDPTNNDANFFGFTENDTTQPRLWTLSWWYSAM